MLTSKNSIRHSLITVSYNNSQELLTHWDGVELSSDVEWIVVDNASADNSVSVARALGATVVESETNLGFGKANNVGFRASRGQFIWFLNPDVRPKPFDLDKLAEVALRESALVAPQLINPDGTAQPNGRGNPYLIYKVMNRLAESQVSSKYHVYAGRDEVVECAWLMGAAVGGSRELVEELGPWDERFFVYYEDSDLGLRSTLLGHPNLVVGSCRWVHAWARETSGFRWRAWQLELTSLAKFYSRYPALLWFPRTLGVSSDSKLSGSAE